MDKAAIKAFAVGARKKLMASISRRTAEIMGESDDHFPGLLKEIGEKGFDAVVEEASYTWFTRLIGVRFMEANGYLPGGVRILSSAVPGQIMPDIVAAAPQPDKSDALFTSLFIESCHSLAKFLPDFFESRCSCPDPLLCLSYHDENGIVRCLVDNIPEEDFREAVEIVGWLYQYYNDARKNEVVGINGGRVKREDVPAATQFFTTDWVARGMVDNSLGKYWLERNPHSVLKKKLEFYLGTEDGRILEKVSPLKLRVLDPCMGSGHILVYAFEVLIEIYKECGYSGDEAAERILSGNLYGLDIDRRSYQLTYFALLMKARSYNADILTKDIHLNLYDIQESNGIGEDLLSFVANGDEKMKTELQKWAASLHDAREYGSLIQAEPIDFAHVFQRVEEIRQQECGNLFDMAYREDTLTKLLPLLSQAQVMTGKYTVVATNPPYLNRMNKNLKAFVNRYYRDYAGDLFSVFIYRSFDFCQEDGYCAFMSPFVWMFIKTYEKLRRYIITNKSISSLIQLEYSAFEEATVPICTFVLKNGPEEKPGVYLKLSDFRGGMEVQKRKVIEAVHNPKCSYRFETTAKQFTLIPGMPIAYWANERFGKIFSNIRPIREYAVVTNGLFTCNNRRFLRFWYEVPRSEIHFRCDSRLECQKSTLKWYPYNKGGDFRKWYGNQEYVVDFQNFGEEISAYRVHCGQSASFPGQNYYFSPGVSWSFVSSSKFGVRYYPEGFVFDIAGSSVFAGRENDTYYILGFLSSNCAFKMLNLINPTLNYQAGNIARLPLRIDESHRSRIDALVAENISISKADWDFFETSWNFKTHPLLHFRPRGKSCKITDAFAAWEDFTNRQFNRLKENEEELNRIFLQIYNLQDELTPQVEERDVTIRRADFSRDIRSFISFAVGCMFGRYQVSGFDPGGTDLMPISPYLKNDIVSFLITFVHSVFGEETLQENLVSIASALDGSGDALDVIRSYFKQEFYRDHLKIYKKRPIYWLLDGGAFQALCYMHAYNENTFSKALGYLTGMQSRLEAEAGRENISPQQKHKLEKQLDRLQSYRSALKRAAAQKIKLNLDDGVMNNYLKVQGGENLFPAAK